MIFMKNELAGAFLILCLLLVLCIILYCFSIGPVMRYEARLKEKSYPIIIKFFGPFDYKERTHNIINYYKLLKFSNYPGVFKRIEPQLDLRELRRRGIRGLQHHAVERRFR